MLVSAAQAGSPLHIRIEGLKVLSVYGDWYGYGIFVERQAHVWISNAIVEESAGGIGVADDASVTARHCRIFGNEGSGIMLRRSAKARIVRCHISSNWWGISSSVDDSLEVEETAVSGNGSGMHLKRGRVARCTIRGNQDDIVLSPWSKAELEDNLVTVNKGYGIALRPDPGETLPWPPSGFIVGRCNRVFGNSEGGAISLPALRFLTEAEGGELDCKLS